MSNFRSFVRGQSKGKGGEAEAKPKAVPAAPLVDDKQTRPVDVRDPAVQAAIAISASGGKPAAVEVPDDQEVTAEVDTRAKPASKPEADVVSQPAPVPNAMAPPPSTRRTPVAPVEAAPSTAEEKAPEAPARAAAAPPIGGGPPIDMGALLEMVKKTVSDLLAPVAEEISGLKAQAGELATKVEGLVTRVAEAEETVARNDGVITNFGAGLDEMDETLESLKGDVGSVKDKAANVDDVMAGLGQGLDTLFDNLFGANEGDPEKVFQAFGGRPIIPALAGNLSETSMHVASLVGVNGERTPSLINDNASFTAKSFVILLLKQKPDEADLFRNAVERGYDTSKDVLHELATNESYAVEITGTVYLAPAESLDDADKAELKATVIARAKAVSQRASIYFDRMDWAAVEAEWTKQYTNRRDE